MLTEGSVSKIPPNAEDYFCSVSYISSIPSSGRSNRQEEEEWQSVSLSLSLCVYADVCVFFNVENVV